MKPFSHQYEIRPAGADDTAAMFVVRAALSPIDAALLMSWTQDLEERLESGSWAWVVADGRRLAGFAVVDPLPGLPGIANLFGGIVPARQRQGLGTRLLRHVQAEAKSNGIRLLASRFGDPEEEPAAFLLRRGFFVEHEECLLELPESVELPSTPHSPQADLVTYPPEKAITAFRRVYDESFSGRPWSQPYSEAEVASSLARPEDLLFAEVGGKPVGVVWHEILPDDRGQVEPLGIVPEWQGRGLGRRLLLAAVHDLRRRGAKVIEIGLWRDNTAAYNLYSSVGFVEVGRWHFLAFDTGTG